jgi:hypothetical protein
VPVSLSDRPARRLLATALGGWLALLPATAHPADQHAAAPACTTTIQALVDAATPGATVTVPGCIYRETVTISKPMTLVGGPGAELRGSDVWTEWWSAGNGLWLSRNSVPSLPEVSRDPNACAPNTSNRCLWPEQVFVDGVALEPLPAGSRPGTGQFALVGGGDRRVLLGQNPHGHAVEVTTRARWIVTAADGVTIRSMTMRHAGNGHASAAVSNDWHSNWVLADSTLSDAHAADVSLDGGSSVQVLRNDISRAGLGGVYGQRVSGGLVRGNTIHHNQTAQFNHDWGAAGLKVAVVQGFVIDGNEVADNDGVGLWCDISCANVTFSNNRVHHNAWQGINFEISTGASIDDNAVWENGWGNARWGWGAGIVISTSANADVSGNTVAWNYAGISVVSQGRPDAPPEGPSGNFVHDNTIARQSILGDFSQTYWQNLSLGWLGDNVMPLEDPSRNNRASNNRFWYDQPEGQTVRFAWRIQFQRLAEFAEEQGGAGSRYMSRPELDAALSARGMPLAPEMH